MVGNKRHALEAVAVVAAVQWLPRVAGMAADGRPDDVG